MHKFDIPNIAQKFKCIIIRSQHYIIKVLCKRLHNSNKITFSLESVHFFYDCKMLFLLMICVNGIRSFHFSPLTILYYFNLVFKEIFSPSTKTSKSSTQMNLYIEKGMTKIINEQMRTLWNCINS